MSVAQAPRSTASTKKPRKPDPSRVYQVFLHEASSVGRRNAASRTATAFGLSDDTIRRIVARFEKVDDTPPEVQYTPAPGQVEYEVQRDQQALTLAQQQPQNMPATAASVKVEPQSGTQLDDHRLRPFMSNSDDATGAFERDLRQSMPLVDMPTPQTASPQRRTNELEASPQTRADSPQLARGILEPFPNPDPLPGPVPPPIPNPMPDPLPPEPIPPIVERGISLRDDYARRRNTPAVARLSIPALDWGQLVAYTGPVLLLAFLLYQIVMSAAR